jgi:hypothetical protein
MYTLSQYKMSEIHRQHAPLLLKPILQKKMFCVLPKFYPGWSVPVDPISVSRVPVEPPSPAVSRRAGTASRSLVVVSVHGGERNSIVSAERVRGVAGVSANPELIL